MDTVIFILIIAGIIALCESGAISNSTSTRRTSTKINSDNKLIDAAIRPENEE